MYGVFFHTVHWTKEIADMRKSKIKFESSESQEQRKVFDWAANVKNIQIYSGIELMFHIPNEGKRTIAYANKLKSEGLLSGVSDICIPVAKGVYHGFFIEMKYNKNTLTQEQRSFLSGVKKQGYATAVCYSANEAIKLIQKYFLLDRKE